MNQLQLVAAPRLRLAVAIGLGALAIVTSVFLVITDGLDASVKWTHHAGVSAAPLLFVAGAIAAVSIAQPTKGRHALLRFVAVVAFASWGSAQLFPKSGAAGALNDAAILLFVVDAGYVVISDARSHLGLKRPAASDRDPSEPASITRPSQPDSSTTSCRAARDSASSARAPGTGNRKTKRRASDLSFGVQGTNRLRSCQLTTTGHGGWSGVREGLSTGFTCERSPGIRAVWTSTVGC